MKRRLSFLVCLFPFFTANSQHISQEQKVSNLETFTRLCGYVRYFHPSDEAANLNWEKFIYYGSKEVEHASNPKELTQKLNGLFNPIAPSVQIVQDKQAKSFDLKSITPSIKAGMNEITWQHYGLGNDDGLYKSARTNRSIKIKDSKRSPFGVATSYLNPVTFRGKKFRLKGWMRTDVTTGQGQIWVRVDREGKERGFFENMDERPVKSKEWKAYEIAGTIDSDAKGFVFGAFLVGEGKVWVDNFTLEIEENGTWQKTPLLNSSFEQKDTQGWTTKTAGYKFETVKDAGADGQQALLISDNSTSEMVKSLFDEKPAFGAYFSKSIGNGISCVVPQVLLGTDSQTYPAANSSRLQELQKKVSETTPELMDASDVYVRLSSINIAWNVFQHFFPYKEEINLEWEKELTQALNAAYESKTRQEFGKALRIMTEKLKDGHVSVSFGEQNYFSIQADVAYVEGKILVSKADSLPLKAGDMILSINGTPAMDHFASLKREISGSDQWKNNNATSQFLYGNKNTELVLKISRDGTEQEFHFSRKGYRNPVEKPKIKRLEEGVYYVNIGNTEMKDISVMVSEFTSAKAIICDLRGYPRNNHEVINHLLSVQDKSKWMFVPRIVSPDYENVSYTGLGWNMSPQTPHISAKMIFLTGGGAISYAESFMGFIKHYKLATIVGQPTAGANGNVNQFTLPGNYAIRFTGMKVKLHDGGQMFNLGIQPDVFVNQTINGISAGRDEYLEKALELIK